MSQRDLFLRPFVPSFRGGARRVPSRLWQRLENAETLLDTSLQMGISLRFGDGTELHLAMRAARMRSPHTGEERVWEPGLAGFPVLGKAVQWGQAASAPRSVNLRLPRDLVPVSSCFQRGLPLAGEGEVCLLEDGGNLEERIVLLRGRMLGGISLGPPGSEVSLTLSDPKLLQNRPLPPWRTDVASWDNAAEKASGAAYPMGFGAMAGVPLLPVDTPNKRWLLGTWPGGTVQQIFVDGVEWASGDVVYGWSQSTVSDGKGNPVKVVSFTGTYADWTFTEDVRANLSGSDPDTLLEVWRYLVEGYSGVGPDGLDTLLLEKSRARMPVMEVQALINGSSDATSTGTLEYLESGLLTDFPMLASLYTERGYGVAVLDARPAQERPLFDWTRNRLPLLGRVSDPEESPLEELISQVVIRYGRELNNDTFAGAVVLDATNEPRLVQTLRLLGGVKNELPIDSSILADVRGASYVASWLLFHRGRLSYRVVYGAVPSLYDRIDPGDPGRITDDEMGWDRALAVVEEVMWTENGSLEVAIRVWPT